MYPTICLGLDPGTSGGIAAIYPDGSVHAQKMLDTIKDLWQTIRDYSEHEEYRVVAYIEKVGGFMGPEAGSTGKKINRASGHTMFTFGKGYGYLEMALTAARIPY